MRISAILGTGVSNTDFMVNLYGLRGEFFMDKLFRQAILNPLIQKPAAIIYALWQNLGCPVPPGGPNTEVSLNISWCGPDADGVPHLLCEQYDDSIIQLFELCGVYYLGRNCWVVKNRNGNERWEEFSEKSRKIALNYVANELWNVFCSR